MECEDIICRTITYTNHVYPCLTDEQPTSASYPESSEFLYPSTTSPEPETTTPPRSTPDGCTARNNRSGFVNTTNYPYSYPNRDSWCVYIRGEVSVL